MHMCIHVQHIWYMIHDTHMYLYYMYVYTHTQVDTDLEIKAYYAGHVLGAAMFQVKVRHQSVVYTVSLSVQPQQCCVLP